MASKLTNKDYQVILNYYNIPFTETTDKSKIKSLAEDILATKLCKCIKKVKKTRNDTEESPSIAICKDSVINKKNLQVSKFSCKNKFHLIPKKNTTIKLLKIKKLNIPYSKKNTRKSRK